jgi:hypothetical protein
VGNVKEKGRKGKKWKKGEEKGKKRGKEKEKRRSKIYLSLILTMLIFIEHWWYDNGNGNGNVEQCGMIVFVYLQYKIMESYDA